MKKYEFTGETKVVNHIDGSEITLKQIRAIRGFENQAVYKFIDKDTLGGWIQDESNLSHEGTCWVDMNSHAYGQSMIVGNAYVHSSIIRDEAIVENDTYIYRSDVHGKSLICGDSIIQNSTIDGDSVIAQQSEVDYCSLKNVKTLVGSTDYTTWKKFMFNDCSIISDDFFIEITHPCTLKRVNLSGRKICFHAESTLTNVSGKVNKFIVQSPLEMKNVKLQDETSVKFKSHRNDTTILGDENNPILFDSGNLVLTNCEIYGSAKIKGHWIISESSISDFAVLKNESTQIHYIEKSAFSDFSSLLCEEDYNKGATRSSYDLSMDDSVAIE